MDDDDDPDAEWFAMQEERYGNGVWEVVEEEPVAEPADDKPAGQDELATVEAFDFKESEIPPRPWIIPGVMLAGYTHMLAAPGGSGKSLFTLQLAIALGTGTAWGDLEPRKPCRTLVINVEDDLDEQRRRLSAARRIMEPDMWELSGMIYLAQNPENIIVARSDPSRKTVVATPIVETLCRFITENNIDVLIVDPFAETFEGDENSNSEVKWAMKVWRDQIAKPTGCAVYLVHHTTKHAGGGAGDADIVRGAGAIVNSTRITSTLMPMTVDEAEAAGINPANRFLYVRFDDAKANQSLKSGKARWFEKVSVTLGNGTEEGSADEVGALRPWRIPGPFDGITVSHLKRVQHAIGNGKWKHDHRSPEWVGRAVADVLMLDPDEKKDRTRITLLLKEWIKNEVLCVVEDFDNQRKLKKFVEVGKWVEE